MDENYREKIRGRIEEIRKELDDLTSHYSVRVGQQMEELTNVEKLYLKGETDIGAVPAMLDAHKRWIYESSAEDGVSIGKVFSEVADLVTTADTPEKKGILYEELESVWGKKKKKEPAK